jgi:hypothetical protein
VRFSMSRSAVTAVALVGVVVAALGACGGSSPSNEAGSIVGQAPICYGPGPNDNLKPIISIRAVRADGLVRKIQVHTSSEHNRYRMSLPPGRYIVSTYSGHVATSVQPGQTTTNVDLPQPGCV